MKRLKPTTTVYDLVKSDTFGALRPIELLIYLRIVAASELRGRVLSISNSELGHPPVTVRAAMQRLDRLELIKLTYGDGAEKTRRTVELLK